MPKNKVFGQAAGGRLQYFYAWRCECIQQKCNIDLQPNVIGPGAHIVHGKIVNGR